MEEKKAYLGFKKGGGQVDFNKPPLNTNASMPT